MTSLFRTLPHDDEARLDRTAASSIDPFHAALGVLATILLVLGVLVAVIDLVTPGDLYLTTVGLVAAVLAVLSGAAAGIAWPVLGSVAWRRDSSAAAGSA